MSKYLLTYIYLLTLFLFGCSATVDKRVESVGNGMLEKRIDDLSGTITLVVHDGNRLHNDIEDIKISNKTIQQKIEGLEATVRNLNEQIVNFSASAKTTEIVKPPAEETDVKPQLSVADSSKSSDKPESDIHETISIESQMSVAKGFWDAMNAKDIQAAKSYVTKESSDKLKIQDTDTNTNTNCKATFGNVKTTEDNHTIIETTLHAQNGTTAFEVALQTILAIEDGQWKVDADKTMMSIFGGKMGEIINELGNAMAEEIKKGIEVVGKSLSEGMKKGVEEMTQAGEAKPDITPQKEELAVINEPTKSEDLQKAAEETPQTGEAKPDITPPKQETTAISEQTESEGLHKADNEIAQTSEAKPDTTSQRQELAVGSEENKRELFLKNNIVRLAETEFPDNKGIQWNILSFEHKAHLTYIEVEPAPANVSYQRFKFAVSFKNPEMPRIIGIYGFKDGQYNLFNAKKK